MHQLKRTQFIPASIDTCWNFFSSPKNLKEITPSYMGFDVLTEVPETMYEGLMIAYRVRPLWSIPLGWITEIKTVKDKTFFVDEQRKGPYLIWHHEHHFKPVQGGVEMTDIVTYVLPMGIVGKLMHTLLVRKKIEEIFNYRYHKVETLFAGNTQNKTE